MAIPGSSVTQLLARDMDNDPLVFGVSGEEASRFFAVEPDTGVVWLRQPLDREVRASHTLPQFFPGGQGQTLREAGSSSFRGLPLRPHSDPEVASSCLNGVPPPRSELTSGLGIGMRWVGCPHWKDDDPGFIRHRMVAPWYRQVDPHEQCSPKGHFPETQELVTWHPLAN